MVVVDDDENFRTALTLLLQLDRFEVVGEATDGYEAVEVAARTQPAFVIVDTVLPGRDGQEAARLIREVAPEARIVASSGYLRERPPWADAFLDKTDIASFLTVLKGLSTEATPDAS